MYKYTIRVLGYKLYDSKMAKLVLSITAAIQTIVTVSKALPNNVQNKTRRKNNQFISQNVKRIRLTM